MEYSQSSGFIRILTKVYFSGSADFFLLGIPGLWYDKIRIHAQEGGGRMASRLRKFAVISDIHGNLPALNAVPDDAKNHGISEFIFAGDH